MAPPAAADTIGSVTGFSAAGTTQTLARGPDEQFYGTGLRLGEWALRDKSVPVKVSHTWKPGQYPPRRSAPPFTRSITVHDGSCLTTLDAGTANGTALTLATRDGTDPRRWTLT
ncbi:RICIN domain-containing protein [Nonomuraea sp. NPDC050451]|uniref:RICIN domain-containing protein n=1 Tax=Nonomuraea sp. NPDC050451 TaxID=3364364 RepID=UPI003799A749